jgi:glycosyltransferase involved in cell wall biosynthesis
MNDSISFSFIMPAFKAKFLKTAIESILKQSYSNFELVIVNDVSPENLKEVVDYFSDNRIIYKENESNIGGTDLVANWNHCIKYAHNDYIILSTDDDTYESDFLLEATKLIKKHPNVNLIRSGVKKIGEKDQVLDIEFPLKEFMTSREFALCWAKGITISCVSNYIFKRESLIAMGGFVSFPHAHFSDDATALALTNNGVANIQKNCMNFRMSNLNLSNRGDYRIAIQQIKATDEFMSWFISHVAKLDTAKGDYFERACYGGCKNRYISLLEKLLPKIPFNRFYLAIKLIYSLKHLFKNEKLRLSTYYFINKL